MMTAALISKSSKSSLMHGSVSVINPLKRESGSKSLIDMVGKIST